MSDSTASIRRAVELSVGSTNLAFEKSEHLQVADLALHLQTDGWTVRIVDANQFDCDESVFHSFSSAFQFPDYFGNNWDAFIDCMSDLVWLASTRVCLIIDHCGPIANSNPATLAKLFEALKYVLDRFNVRDSGERFVVLRINRNEF